MPEITTGIIASAIGKKLGSTILDPLVEIVTDEVTDITTTIGSFIIKKIRGKFQRSIEFTTNDYCDRWMEDALYGIIYKYNNIKNMSGVELVSSNDNGMYYRLSDGTHSLKYRNFDILLNIKTTSVKSVRSITNIKTFTIITYNLDPSFAISFEKDMLINRNSLLKISTSNLINVFEDEHESDGYTYWRKSSKIPKRSLNTIYLPSAQKKLIIDTINNFIGSKKIYEENGIPWILTIVLHGVPATGKDSLVKMIASEYCRNIFLVGGGKGGKFIPDAIMREADDVIAPLYLISDIDRYPFIINEQEINIGNEDDADKIKEETLQYKQIFAKMLNALDGVTSGGGKIIIMTTNHIEYFSPTLLRAGRVDLCMELKYVETSVFRKYVYDKYGKILPEDIKIKDDITIGMMQRDSIIFKLPYEEFIKKYLQ